MGYCEALKAHLAAGCTTLCRVWAVTRPDGRVLGFTDHDRALGFDGIDFRPESGMTARALAQTTGLSVDNSEAVGALSSAAITEADIQAGRYDGAEVRAWLVNWADVGQRALLFRGHLGEIRRAEGAFTAELRGLAEALGREQGRIYHPRCSAILGDAACRVDLAQAGYLAEVTIETVAGGQVFGFANLRGFADRWFEKGRFDVLTGAAAGLVGVVKNDRLAADGERRIELWQGLRAPVSPGDRVRISAGCDRREETCRLKFANFLNFRGFPHLPGEDWMSSYPARTGGNDGGRMSR
ncbi:hypothetical protein CCR83_04770 [Rhodobacter veldkampii DSM 11550]|uniref:Bacteriophage phiJL001 Gp84 C-terminal domain-containing protein n=1 Tax=Phaeovulum veldkampii DSM 11550 TaxID=1185920 RepID=A0A2T4JNE3_9RHOB|nr:DUF2163 domain-containing protein [Phaeovulum veldkampii]MBK5945780.1 hypothetical protein [Phaeovulum veldkampii DSM 11550]PTE19277.1 hypothetical protein C5F46_00555 [Phaeovulum veldkampii DSM 11550]TDQ62236.1 putative phage protein (TIGR02218 family) [Phaeovulum veldkampii DSM 11550]